MSATVVLKFGGTSLGGPARVRRAAARVRAALLDGRRVVAVVSAAGDETDRLLARLHAVGVAGGDAAAREADRALATGEDLSAALLAAALRAAGVPARSLRGPEAGVEAVGDFGAGRIRRVDPRPLARLLRSGAVAVVSGFQGLRDDGETVTLGRGGSDTSAVAIAAALGARADIVTDVPAVFERDPRTHPAARPFERVSWGDLLRLADDGARVVHPEAARLALAERVPLRVHHWRAPLRRPGGTRVGPEPTRLRAAEAVA